MTASNWKREAPALYVNRTRRVQVIRNWRGEWYASRMGTDNATSMGPYPTLKAAKDATIELI